MVKNGFLHCHTMFSLFDSAVTPDELVKRAKELGAENITLTDHGTLLGIEPFMDAGAKYKINTIPGVELYLKHREHLPKITRDIKQFPKRCVMQIISQRKKVKKIKIAKREAKDIMPVYQMMYYFSLKVMKILLPQQPVCRDLLQRFFFIIFESEKK